MKKLALAVLFSALALAGDKYQVCGIMPQTGEVICGGPKNRQGAELAALAFNAVSHGQFVAWVQRIPKVKKAKPSPPAEVPALPEGLPQTN